MQLLEFHFIYNFGGIFVFLEKSRYFTPRQKSSHLLKCSLFWPKTWKIRIPNHAGQPHIQSGGTPATGAHTLAGSKAAMWPYRVAQESSQWPHLCELAQPIRELRPDGTWLCRAAPPRAKGGSRRHERLRKMEQVRLQETHVRGLVTELVLTPI